MKHLESLLGLRRLLLHLTWGAGRDGIEVVNGGRSHGGARWSHAGGGDVCEVPSCDLPCYRWSKVICRTVISCKVLEGPVDGLMLYIGLFCRNDMRRR